MKIAAIVPLFKPGREAWDVIAAVIPQVDLVILIDDSGETDSDSAFELSSQLTADVPVQHHKNGRNIGIAATLNIGLDLAAQHGATHVLTVDQDTHLAAHHVEALRTFTDQVSATGFAPDQIVVAAGRVNNVDYLHHHKVSGFRCSLHAIQSGTLFPVAAFSRAGKFDETLFIDGVEHDFFLRLHKVGGHVFLLDGLDLSQNLGSPQRVKVLGKSVTVWHHAPFRRYYMTRNMVRLAGSNLRYETNWSMHTLRWLASTIAKALLFEPNRRKNFRAVTLGLTHAAAGRGGPAPRI